MKAGDLHELLFLLVRYARLDSLQQGVGLERTETETFKGIKLEMSFTNIALSML